MESLLKIKRLLIETINEVDNLIDERSPKNELIIFKKDFHKIKFIKEDQHQRQIFEYDGLARFALRNDVNGHPRLKYLSLIFTKFSKGDLEHLILIKLPDEKDGINYMVEEEINSNLRVLYGNK